MHDTRNIVTKAKKHKLMADTTYSINTLRNKPTGYSRRQLIFIDFIMGLSITVEL